MKNPQVMFPILCFIEPIDLEKIQFCDPDLEYSDSFLSRTPTTMGRDRLTEDSYHYLCSEIAECIGQFSDEPFFISQVWRNKYEKTDWQDPHIHSGAQWSFVIYNTVEEGKTVFMHPSRKDIMNQWGIYSNIIPMDFIPNLPPKHIIIFPSWIEHYVLNGNEGITISGNIHLEKPPVGP
jgi:hypothetical protein